VSFLRNQRGFFHFHINSVIIILAMVGAWYMYNSYRNDRVAENLNVIVQDYKKLAMVLAKDEKTKTQIESLFSNSEMFKNKDDLMALLVSLNKILTNEVMSNPRYSRSRDYVIRYSDER